MNTSCFNRWFRFCATGSVCLLLLFLWLPQPQAQPTSKPTSQPTSQPTSRPTSRLTSRHQRERKRAQALYRKARRIRSKHRKRSLLLLQQSYGILKHITKPSDPLAMKVMTALELTYYRLGMYRQSLVILHEQMALRARLLPKGHPKILVSLRNIALLYSRTGKYKQAIQYYQRALRLLQERYPATHPKVAKIIYYMGRTYTKLGQHARARRLLLQALRLQRKALGPTHTHVGHTLNSLGVLLLESGRYEQAILHFQQVYPIWKAKWGPQHRRIAHIWHHLGLAHIKLEQFAKAKAALQRALAIRKKRLAAHHPLLANSYNDLGILFSKQGKMAEALPLYQYAWKSQWRRLGPTHPSVLTMQHNLALAHARMGLYQQARRLAKEVLHLRTKKLGAKHPHVAFDQATMARIWGWEGAYQKALGLLQKALALRLQRLGPSHLLVAGTRLELAQLRIKLAQDQKALSLLRQALEPVQLRRKHPLFVARVLQAQAEIAARHKQPGRAYSLLVRALQAFRTQGIHRHPHAALLRSKIGHILAQQGKFSEALAMQKRALQQLQEKFKRPHPWVALVLVRLASVSAQQGKAKQGIAFATRATHVLEGALGPMAHQLAQPLQLLARLYVHVGQRARAMVLIQRAWDLQWRILQEVFALASWRQRLQFLHTLNDTRDLYLSIALRHHRATHQTKVAWIRQVWQSKGLLHQLLLAQQEAIQGKAPKTAAHRKWLDLQQQIARLAWRGPIDKSPKGWKSWRRYLRSLRRARDAFERTHHSASSAQTFLDLRRKSRLTQVQAHLHPTEALVEFVRFRKVAFAKAFAVEPNTTPHYIAFMINARQGTLVDLGAAKPAVRAIRSLRRWLPKVPAGYLGGVRRALHKLTPANDLLLRRIWRPLQAHLKGIRHLFLSPDGALVLLPFEILRQPNRRYLVETHSISYLLHGLQLVSFRQSRTPRTQPVKPSTRQAQAKPTTAPTIRPTTAPTSMPQAATVPALPLRRCRVVLFGDPAFGAPLAREQMPHFSRLRGSRTEIQQAAKLLQGSTFLGSRASKANFLRQFQLHPDLVHIATHGFFVPGILPKRRPAPSKLVQGTRAKSEAQNARFERVERHFHNPLLRSGFVLAGANGGRGQGIVSALEISSFSLPRTALVVLSACDTGVGTSRPWQGIQGLRSAFVRAGVQSLVLSLWKIPDRETATLMNFFYKNLRRHRHRHRAFRQAQIDMIQHLRTSHGVAHPFYWGAFVFQGSPWAITHCRLPSARSVR